MPVVINGTTGITAPAVDAAVDASDITSGTLATARLGTGTADSSTFLRGDQTWGAAGNSGYGIRRYQASGIYTPDARVKEFIVVVYGSTGGNSAHALNGGCGGPGYAEKRYTAPFTGSPYTVTIGAAGTNTGGNGGTTSFDTISITGSGGVNNSVTGGAGGVATGGDFNANGGDGGTGRSTATAAGGGGGGAGSRAGNGGRGGDASASATGGSGGGTGGNNASGVDNGAAATTVAAGALDIPIALYGYRAEVAFRAGNLRSAASGGEGADPTVRAASSFASRLLAVFSGSAAGGGYGSQFFPAVDLTGFIFAYGGSSSSHTGTSSQVFIIEVY